MSQIADLVKRFPLHELAIRRRYAENATFRGICEDYGEASHALRHWHSTGTATNEQIEHSLPNPRNGEQE